MDEPRVKKDKLIQMMTRADVVQVSQLGGPEMMRLVQENLPPPGLGQVQVRHTAIGFNYIDIYQRSGLLPRF